MDRIDLSEDVREQEVLVGLDHGTVKLTIESGGRQIAFAEIDPYPVRRAVRRRRTR